jgi:hypothetical protein
VEWTPFTPDEFIQAGYGLEMAENVPQVRTRPRVSSLAGCAREIAYQIAGVPLSNPSSADTMNGMDGPQRRDHGVLTTEGGRIMEDLSAAVIEQLSGDIEVADRQMELPIGYFVSGHPDGRLQRKGIIARELHDGLIWGFEHKYVGRFKYLKIFKEGFERGAPDYFSQVILYGHALGWDKVTVVIMAQDASSMNMEANNALGAKTRTSKNSWPLRLDWNPKVQVYHLDLRPWYALIPRLEERANSITSVTQTLGAAAVRRDGDGVRTYVDYKGLTKLSFPCGYCDFADQCNADGDGTEAVCPLPSQLGG